jgi:hypothetical protein
MKKSGGLIQRNRSSTFTETDAKALFRLFYGWEKFSLLLASGEHRILTGKKKGEKTETDENTSFNGVLVILAGCFLMIMIVTEISCFQFK